VGAKYADLSDKLNTGKSYIIFGKTNTNAVNLIKLGELLILVKSKVRPAPSNLRVSTPPPPSTLIFGKTDTNAVDLAKLGGDSRCHRYLNLH
jgi:hypothetical protein